MYGSTWWQEQSPQAELSTGSSKLLEPSTQVGERAARKHWDVRVSPHSLQSLIFYLPVTQHKTSPQLSKRPKTGPMVTVHRCSHHLSHRAHCPGPTLPEEKTLQRRWWHDLPLLSVSSLAEILTFFFSKSKIISQGWSLSSMLFSTHCHSPTPKIHRPIIPAFGR